MLLLYLHEYIERRYTNVDRTLRVFRLGDPYYVTHFFYDFYPLPSLSVTTRGIYQEPLLPSSFPESIHKYRLKHICSYLTKKREIFIRVLTTWRKLRLLSSQIWPNVVFWWSSPINWSYLVGVMLEAHKQKFQ